MKKAISKITEKSIDFQEKYHLILRSKDKNRLFGLYNSDFSCGQSVMERWFQLMLRYNREKCAGLSDTFCRKFGYIVDKMKKYPEELDERDLELFPQAACLVVQEGIYNNLQELIQIYMDYLMKN